MKHEYRTPLAVLAAGLLMTCTPLASAAGVAGRGTWETSLLARDYAGNGVGIDAYYDPILDLTWARDANLAKTRGDDDDGFVSAADANAWATALTLFGGDDWRLPKVAPVNGTAINETFTNNGSSDVGYAATGRGWGTHSELGYMFYVHLGNQSFYIADDADPEGFELDDFNPLWEGIDALNPGPFQHLAERPDGVSTVPYWTSTTYFDDTFYLELGFGLQWYFDFGFDVPGAGLAWAVHEGDLIGPAPIPVPPALPLFGTALAGVVLRARRRTAPR